MDSLRRTFHEISVGYSQGKILGHEAFIKHIGYADQIEHDFIREAHFNDAHSLGLPTNEERLRVLRREGLWTDEMERQMEDSRVMIDSIIEAKRQNAKMPSMVKRYNEQMKEEEKRYTNLYANKLERLGFTCESYADRQVRDYYIYTNIYADREMTRLLFKDTERDMGDERLNFSLFENRPVDDIITEYNNIVAGCSEHGIKKLAMQPFFQNYFSLVDTNVYQFFGKPICALTFYQVKLLTHGRHFLHIYQNHDIATFPKEVLEDPDALIDHTAAVARGKQDMEKQGAYEENSKVIGGNPEDTKALGIKNAGIDLNKEMAANGGELGLDWFLKQAK